MNPRRAARLGLIGVLCAACASTWGFGIDWPQGRAVNAPGEAPITGSNAPSARLREGVITNMSGDGRQVEIQGKWYALVDGQTKVIRGKQAATPSSLKKGEAIKFTLTQGDNKQTALAVIYVQ